MQNPKCISLVGHWYQQRADPGSYVGCESLRMAKGLSLKGLYSWEFPVWYITWNSLKYLLQDHMDLIGKFLATMCVTCCQKWPKGISLEGVGISWQLCYVSFRESPCNKTATCKCFFFV